MQSQASLSPFRFFDLGTYEDDAGRAAIRVLHREPEAAAIGRLL
jgi:hypothetical protein